MWESFMGDERWNSGYTVSLDKYWHDNLRNSVMKPSIENGLTKIVGTQLDDEDIGAAIQFLEFCCAFTEVVKERKNELNIINIMVHETCLSISWITLEITRTCCV